MNLTDTYRIFHPKATEYTFFSAAHPTFTKKDYILEHKASFNKYKKIEITYCILSDYKGIELEINNKTNDQWLLKK
jgi:exonuclease III